MKKLLMKGKMASSSEPKATNTSVSFNRNNISEEVWGTSSTSSSKDTTNITNTNTSSTPVKQFYDSLRDPTVVERVRVTLPNAHVFKLPPRKSAGGWRGADWREEVWVGTCKVVDRNNQTAVVLFQTKKTEGIYAVCLQTDEEDAIDRCVDSSRYFVLRIEHPETNNRIYIGLAFNDRNDAFDFNASLEDAKRERQAELLRPALTSNPSTITTATISPSKDYSLAEGQKIHVHISSNKSPGVNHNPTTNNLKDPNHDEDDDGFIPNSDEEEDDQGRTYQSSIHKTTTSTKSKLSTNTNTSKIKHNTNVNSKETTKAKSSFLLAPSTKDSAPTRLRSFKK